jgi:hypothetical protein
MSDTGVSPLAIRPLPIGAFPLPFGFLLLPADEETEPVRTGLLAGRLPERWPDVLRGHQAALAGDLDAARAAFAGPDPVSRFNRFVLDPDAVDPAALRAGLGPELGVLVDLVEFATGRRDTAPDPGGHQDEIRALLLAAAAVDRLGSAPLPLQVTPNDGVAPPAAPPASPGASDLLRSAIAESRPASRALTGVLHGALAQACKQEGDPPGVVTALQAGIALLAGTDLTVARAEQHLELAATFHELAANAGPSDPSGMMAPGLLNQAVRHYHNVLQEVSADGASKDSAPDVWAAAHAGLAAAYLTMPMNEASDQLRLGVAVGSLRAALTVYTRATHPAEWSSAQLNLANALVYAPSAHQGDNLTEAVELYEAVLAARSRDTDPVGYARALANQGNALAHLGMFDHARAKLAEARFLFEEAQEWDATSSVRALLNDLTRAQKDAREIPADA